MKRLMYLLGFIMLAPAILAQDSWKISLNNKIILQTNKSDETLNTKKVSTAEWKKKGFLEVSYTEAIVSNWLHTLQFIDESGNQLLSKDSVYTKVSTSAIRKLTTGKKIVKIYMVVSPSNPMIAAPSRMLHLCTLKLP
jgi:hypothetical protein